MITLSNRSVILFDILWYTKESAGRQKNDQEKLPSLALMGTAVIEQVEASVEGQTSTAELFNDILIECPSNLSSQK